MLDRRAFRNWVKWSFYPALVILALNIENLTIALGWDKLLVGNWSPEVTSALDFFRSAWFQYPALMLVGAALALWLDAHLRSKDIKPEVADYKALAARMKIVSKDIEQKISEFGSNSWNDPTLAGEIDSVSLDLSILGLERPQLYDQFTDTQNMTALITFLQRLEPLIRNGQINWAKKTAYLMREALARDAIRAPQSPQGTEAEKPR